MKLLLDTHVILWAAARPDKLSNSAYEMLLDKQNTLFFSSVNIWEIVIKSNLGRKDFKVDPHRLRKMLVLNDYQEIAVTSEHTLAVSILPSIHKDPFDRILIAQARCEGMTLLTMDATVIAYGASIKMV